MPFGSAAGKQVPWLTLADAVTAQPYSVLSQLRTTRGTAKLRVSRTKSDELWVGVWVQKQRDGSSFCGRPRTNTRRGRIHRRHNIPDNIPAVLAVKCCLWHLRTVRPCRIHQPFFYL